jgi:hypothetical protein
VAIVLSFTLFSCGYCFVFRGKDKTIATGKKGKTQNNSHRKKGEKTKQ